MSAADVITSRTCEGCGQPFERHDGIIVTCRKLHAARTALIQIRDNFARLNGRECDRGCGKCIRCIAARGLDESQPAESDPPEEDE